MLAVQQHLPLAQACNSGAMPSSAAAHHAPIKVLVTGLVLDKAAALGALRLHVVVGVLLDVGVDDGHQLALMVCQILLHVLRVREVRLVPGEVSGRDAGIADVKLRAGCVYRPWLLCSTDRCAQEARYQMNMQLSATRYAAPCAL